MIARYTAKPYTRGNTLESEIMGKLWRYKVLGYIRMPNGDEIKFLNVLNADAHAGRYVHSMRVQKGIECEPVQTYTEVLDFK